MAHLSIPITQERRNRHIRGSRSSLAVKFKDSLSCPSTCLNRAKYIILSLQVLYLPYKTVIFRTYNIHTRAQYTMHQSGCLILCTCRKEQVKSEENAPWEVWGLTTAYSVHECSFKSWIYSTFCWAVEWQNQKAQLTGWEHSYLLQGLKKDLTATEGSE